jgi:3-oxoacyl-[acyl-carrier protein] reductase
MDLGIKGKRAWVMAASSGIGRAVAESLIREGARVAISSRNETTLQATADAIGAELAVPANFLKAGSAAAAAREIVAKWGGIDILITNAGGPPKGGFLDISQEGWHTGFQGLFLSTVEALQVVLPPMREQKWGRVVFVTSVAAKEPIAKLTVSNGIRAGILGLMKSLSHEWAAHGITFNSVLPGYTATERLKELGVTNEEIAKHVPAKRLADPQEVGDLCAFIASDSAGYLNGQAIALDGGQSHSV